MNIYNNLLIKLKYPCITSSTIYIISSDNQRENQTSRMWYNILWINDGANNNYYCNMVSLRFLH